MVSTVDSMTNSEITKTYTVSMERVGEKHYKATNSRGDSIEFGSGEGLLSPVELLLAAVAGCASVDVDVVTSRRSEPEKFTVNVEGDRVSESGASRLASVRAHFDIQFPNDEKGQQAQSMVDRLIAISHDKECTVSRTVENATEVTFSVEK